MKSIFFSWRNLALLVILTGLTSIYFIVSHYRHSLSGRDSSIVLLQDQLLELKKTTSELTESLAIAQENREFTESELTKAMEWEKKYEELLFDNNRLQETVARLQRQFDIDIDRLNRARKFLSDNVDSKNELLSRLSETNRELEQEKAFLESEIQKSRKTIADLKSETSAQKKTIAKLQDTIEPVVGTATSPEPARNTNVAPTEDATDKADHYRHVRIQSLINAMQNQGSGARRNILISVIPTIPNGVSGNELLTLVNGMDSADILAAMESTSQYIIRPLEDAALAALIGKLAPADAEAAAQIFSKGNQ